MSAHEFFQFQTLEQLRQRIGELALALDATEDLSPLLEPVPVNGFILPNRLVVLPMEGCDGTADGAPDELTFRRYHRFAAGGAGLLWFEATAVVPEARANPRQLWLNERSVDVFARLVEAARRAARETMGAGHRPLLIVQLTHSGRYSRPGRAPAPIIAHHSPFLDPVHGLPPDYPLISDEELERLEDRYVEAALLARRAGFDGVDIKACHRYLASELLASHTREDSRYGGPLENRSRLLRNVYAKVRAAAPDLIVTSRMNAYDAMAHPYGFGVASWDPATPDLREPIELVRALHAAGAPLINITVGNPYFNPHVNRPYDLPVSGAPLPPESPLEGVARFAGIVQRIQNEFPALPVVGGGYSWLRQFFPHVAAAQVRQGRVSLVGLGRLAFAYPDFARDIAEKGRLDPERVCVACSACTQIMRDSGRSGCVPRDAAVYEPIYKAGRAEALDTIQQLARTCRQCNDPTCVAQCPARVDIPRFVGAISDGRFREAYETIRQANVLAAVCGYVCPSETLCESGCINRHYTGTVPIRHLQRWVSRKAVEEGWVAEPRPHAHRSGKRVAVLGGGPAGIAAAVSLAGLGHAVTLFDRGAVPGGVAGQTIPAQRLPDPILRREIEDALISAGELVERQAAVIGPGRGLDALFAEGYDSVLVALGLDASMPLDAGPAPRGVSGALEFLRAAKSGGHARLEGVRVLVLGAGNTAIDAAMAAQRLGAVDVAVVYRRSFAEMPAWPNERDEAVRAGVHFLILTQPLGYVAGASGEVAGLRVARTLLGAPDESGRRRPEIIPGTEHVLPAGLVVEALGQKAGEDLRAALAGVAFTRAGRISTGAGSCATSRAGVYAAGDIVNGGATVVEAVAEGARAAREIDRFLKG
jgi:NADPH-dependent glutamate synthase beta subunit-like oxidoreductase/2,4-dienoyl-CoA reductase-like NADH-dependent reductase (Old Yellow Enzyme family)